MYIDYNNDRDNPQFTEVTTDMTINVKWTGGSLTATLNPMIDDDNDGYLSRNAMARVRCVRKQ